MPLEQSTPASTRERWQGTRGQFLDLLRSLAGCMRQIGVEPGELRVEVGRHEGTLPSLDAFRDELTEDMWLRARKIHVSMRDSDWKRASLSVLLDPAEPTLLVVYHGDTSQEREALRSIVERTLPPEPPDKRRHWRWIGPLIGLAWVGTWLLIDTRTPALVHLKHRFEALQTVLFVADQVINFLWPIIVTRLALHSWFPALERLPDSGGSRWDSRRSWVQWAGAAWLAIALAVLALPHR